MDKFRFLIDLGSGYTLINTYNNELKLEVERGISDAIEAKKINGSIVLSGSLAETVYNKRTVGYKLPFKVQEYDGAFWNDLHECYVDIRGQYNRLQQNLVLENFQEFETENTPIIASIKDKFNLTDLGYDNIPILQDTTSQYLDVYSVPTALTPGDYPDNYTLEGFGSELFPKVPADSRWTPFFYVSSTGSSPNFIHQYRVRAFEFDPGDPGVYNKITFNGKPYWVKSTQAGDPNDTYTDNIISQQNQLLANVFNGILDAIDNTLSFNFALAGGGFNAAASFIGNTSEFTQENTEGLELSLEQIFNFLRKTYRCAWYIDPNDNLLKFRWRPLEYYNNTLDFSTETLNVENINFAINPLPDGELNGFLDDNRISDIYVNASFTSSFKYSKLDVRYFEKGVPTDDNIINDENGFYGDLFGLKNSTPESNKPIWSVYNTATKEFFENDALGYYLAGDGSTFGGGLYEGYAEYDRYYINNPDKTQPYNTIVGSGAYNRPIYEMEYETWLNDYVNLSLFTRLLFSNSNEGIVHSYTIDLNNGSVNFKVRFKTINL